MKKDALAGSLSDQSKSSGGKADLFHRDTSVLRTQRLAGFCRDSLTYLKKLSDQCMNNPLLSILCITYNHEKYISEALDSFFAQQTNFAFEVVIGEDCSTDRTKLIVDQYRSIYSDQITVVTSQSNVGVVENFRRTMRACKGKYIAICEGDDYWVDRNKLQAQVDFLEDHSDYVMTFHDAFAFNESGFALRPQLPQSLQCDASMGDLVAARPISTLTVCFRNVMQGIPVEFNSAPILDLCLWSLLGHYGDGKYLGGIQPAAYRLHDGGVMSSQSETNKLRLTAQTYHSLSRYYANQGNEKVSSLFSLKAASMTIPLLGFTGKLRLLLEITDALFGRPLYALKSSLIRK